MDNSGLDFFLTGIVGSFLNPFLVLIVSLILFYYFRSNRSGANFNRAPFIVLATDLVLSTLPILNMIRYNYFYSNSVDHAATGFILILALPSVFISGVLSFFLFVLNLRVIANSKPTCPEPNCNIVSDNIAIKNNNEPVSIVILHVYSVINFIVLFRILWMINYALINEQVLDNAPAYALCMMILPWVSLLVIILIIAIKNLYKKLYNIPILYFIISFIGGFFRLMLSIMLHVSTKKSLVYMSILEDFSFLFFSTWLILKYLKFLKEQQLTQNQDEVQL